MKLLHLWPGFNSVKNPYFNPPYSYTVSGIILTCMETISSNSSSTKFPISRQLFLTWSLVVAVAALLDKIGENWNFNDIFWWSEVKVIYCLHFNDIWLSLHPSTNIHWNLNFHRFFSISALLFKRGATKILRRSFKLFMKFYNSDLWRQRCGFTINNI